MPKTEFDYESKQQSRQKLVNFIIKYYPKDERKTINMVCLPGAQARDVYDITDVLKIPRSNVWGLERDKDVYKIIESKNLGINLFQGTDGEFFKETKDKFDVVSLDYFGQLKDQELNSLRHLFGREVMKPKGVLHTNFYGSRESEKVKEIYKTGSVIRASMGKLKEKSFQEINEIINQGKLDSLLKEGFEEYVFSIKGLREGLTRAIMSVAGSGKFNLKTEDMNKILHYGFEDVDRLESSGIPLRLAYYLAFKENKPYFCDCVERYKYVSDVGSPMLTDIFLFNQHREWFDGREYPIVIDSSNFEKPVVKIKGVPLNTTKELMNGLLLSRGERRESSIINDILTSTERKILTQANRVYGYCGRLRETDIIKDRQFLGSSHKIKELETEAPHPENPSLSKDEIIKLLKEGKTSQWIVENYNADPNQVRAYKAWITMGKY